MIVDFTKCPNRLNHKIIINLGGSKNLTLPLLFFSAAISYKYKLKISLSNYSKVLDVANTIKLLKHIGFSIKLINNKCIFYPVDNLNFNIPIDLYRSIRYSILLIPIFLTFKGYIDIPLKTGGCKIDGERKSDIHYMFYKYLGYDIIRNEENVIIKKNIYKLKRIINFKLPINSTSVTESILLYISLNLDNIKKIEISNLYLKRPEIREIIKFLNLVGIDFNIRNTSTLYGFKFNKVLLKEINFNIFSDFDQLLFYIFFSILSRKNFLIKRVSNFYSYREINTLKNVLGNNFLKFDKYKEIIEINPLFIDIKEKYSLTLVAISYPSIMSDSLPLISLLTFFLKKQLVIEDRRFINRYGYLDYYLKFGFFGKLLGNKIVLYNNYKSHGKRLTNGYFELFSIRESALLLLLALYTKSRINFKNYYILQRGYENLDNFLSELGVINF